MRYLCHDEPNIREFEAQVIDSKPGYVLLSRSAFYPGGGGQLADRGFIEWSGGRTDVADFVNIDGNIWVKIADDAEISGEVKGFIDDEFRKLMMQLHTDLHIVNALVFQEFGGALVTGVQMGAEGTARIDFNLPGADNDRLRALEPRINDVIGQDLKVFEELVPLAQTETETGLLRSKAVTPPPSEDGMLRIIEVEDFDRQACGGTHLTSTGQSRPVKILKIDNKGRQNRRVRIGLVDK